ncbi:MAG: hypothetical protein LLF83_02620 [Methanobacterium sp.]|nr:hypothetical protein [Methanobacterium sp.]
MIQNKTTAIILAVLTFFLGSILLTSLIFYLLQYPLSSIPDHQNYLFLAILASALLASAVYGRGSKERASKVVDILQESFGITFQEKVIYKVLRIIEQMPPFVVEKYINLNINAVEEFENRIKDYKNKLSEEDLLKISNIIETPLEELQDLLNRLYLETGLKQFKLMSEPQAKPLIELNIDELKRVLFE